MTDNKLKEAAEKWGSKPLLEAYLIAAMPDYDSDGAAILHESDIQEVKELLLRVKEERTAASPWQTINPADPGTLPEPGEFFMISFRDKYGDCFTGGAYHYHDNEWYYHDDLDDVIEIYDEVYAWQPWPDPAPYPQKEQTP